MAERGSLQLDTTSPRARFASVEEFVRTEIKAWVLADNVDESGLGEVIADANDAFASYCDDQGAADFPLNGLIAGVAKS
jgi:hypothetical protein